MPPELRPPTLSVCLIVKNERSLLERCLASVKEISNEQIVLDTGSEDGTQQAARAAGATLIQSTWSQDFSAARNQALAAATGDWILVLDADEYLLPAEARTVRELIQRTTAPKAYSLLQQSVGPGGVGGMLVAIVRLFPRHPEVRYEWPIHEQVVTSLARAGIPVEPTNIRIQHTGYADAALNREKQRRNQAILLRQVSGSPTPEALFLLAGTFVDLGDPSGALPWYRRAAEHPDAADELRAGSRLRVASCLARTGQSAEALQAISEANIRHPEALLLQAELEDKLGLPGGRRLRERLLDCPDEAYIPPVNVPALKAGALAGLARYWQALGQKELALEILRETKAKLTTPAGFGKADLASLYASHGVSLAA